MQEGVGRLWHMFISLNVDVRRFLISQIYLIKTKGVNKK